MELEHKELTEKIIGAAIQVHKQLGPGFIESIYEKALMVEFHKRAIQVKAQQEVIVKYDNVEVGRHRLDLFVEGAIVIELKAIKDIEDIHFAIVKSYLKSVDKKHGLLLNFAKVKLEIKRVIYDEYRNDHKDAKNAEERRQNNLIQIDGKVVFLRTLIIFR